ncbi:hypothetical protein [Thioclava electrotropha]|uniref:hypothetical protein n=1 Tax=Thioclava electrotropha TaxID=1549850 RepID=UPI0023A7FEEC|nr:hypothetical protein [Thioclava electrotropha]
MPLSLTRRALIRGLAGLGLMPGGALGQGGGPMVARGGAILVRRAAREQQQDDYKRELAQNRADRENRERAEADQLRASEADFLQKFAPPPGLVSAAPSLRQQAVANAIANKPDPFAARRAQQKQAREAYEERKRELQRRVPSPPPPSPGPPPGPPPGQPSGGLADAFPPRGGGNRAPPPRGGGLEDAFPPRGGHRAAPEPPRNPFEKPPDPLRDPVGRRAGIDPLPQNPFEKPVDPLRDPPGRRAGIDPLPQMQPTAAAGRAAPVEHQIDPLRDAPPPRGSKRPIERRLLKGRRVPRRKRAQRPIPPRIGA